MFWGDGGVGVEALCSLHTFTQFILTPQTSSWQYPRSWNLFFFIGNLFLWPFGIFLYNESLHFHMCSYLIVTTTGHRVHEGSHVPSASLLCLWCLAFSGFSINTAEMPWVKRSTYTNLNETPPVLGELARGQRCILNYFQYSDDFLRSCESSWEVTGKDKEVLSTWGWCDQDKPKRK
jgi:hypothetical protein